MVNIQKVINRPKRASGSGTLCKAKGHGGGGGVTGGVGGSSGGGEEEIILPVLSSLLPWGNSLSFLVNYHGRNGNGVQAGPSIFLTGS